MEVDHIIKGKGKSKGNGKGTGKGNGKSKGKGTKPDNQDKECYVCGKRGHFARANQDKTVNEVEGAKSGLRCGKRVCVRG